MIHFKITGRMLERVKSDLRRPHPFAFERVGFICCRFGSTPTGHLLALACQYYSVEDRDYVEDARFGALIGSGAFRMAFQIAFSSRIGLFHVHMHEGPGTPHPSSIDTREYSQFVPDFFNVQPSLPHGALILSSDSLWGHIWLPETRRPERIGAFSVIAQPIRRIVLR